MLAKENRDFLRTLIGEVLIYFTKVLQLLVEPTEKTNEKKDCIEGIHQYDRVIFQSQIAFSEDIQRQ